MRWIMISLFLIMALTGPAFAQDVSPPCPTGQTVAPCPQTPPTDESKTKPEPSCQSGLCVPFRRIVTTEEKGLRQVTPEEVSKAVEALQGIPAFQERLQAQLKTDIAAASKQCDPQTSLIAAWGIGGVAVGLVLGFLIASAAN